MINWLKISSIVLLAGGLALFLLGMIVYWINTPPLEWYTLVIAVGFLLMLGALIMLVVSIQYDRPVIKK